MEDSAGDGDLDGTLVDLLRALLPFQRCLVFLMRKSKISQLDSRASISYHSDCPHERPVDRLAKTLVQGAVSQR